MNNKEKRIKYLELKLDAICDHLRLYVTQKSLMSDEFTVIERPEIEEFDLSALKGYGECNLSDGFDLSGLPQKIEWKVGEKVWDFVYGWGVVDYLAKQSNYIEVDFESECTSTSYELNGNMIGATNRTLFKKEMKLVEK